MPGPLRDASAAAIPADPGSAKRGVASSRQTKDCSCQCQTPTCACLSFDLTLLSLSSHTAAAAVTQLSLSHCGLTDAPITALAALPLLRVLDLSHNALTTVPSHALRPLSRLVRLNLSHNRLRALPAAAPSLPHLQAVAVHHNPLHCLPLSFTSSSSTATSCPALLLPHSAPSLFSLALSALLSLSSSHSPFSPSSIVSPHVSLLLNNPRLPLELAVAAADSVEQCDHCSRLFAPAAGRTAVTAAVVCLTQVPLEHRLCCNACTTAVVAAAAASHRDAEQRRLARAHRFGLAAAPS